MVSPKSPTSHRAQWATLLGAALLLLTLAPASAQEPGPAGTTAPEPPPAAESPSSEVQIPASDPCLVDTQCEQLYEQARLAFKEARYEDAFNSYQEAYKRRQVPWLLLNSGRALQRLGRLDEALAYYERYKRSDVKPTPERLAKATQYIAEVKAILAESVPHKPAPVAAVAVVPAAPTPPPPAPETRPVYKKWWFWTILGGVVVAGVATGLAVGLPRPATPMSVMQQPAIPTGISVYQPMF